MKCCQSNCAEVAVNFSTITEFESLPEMTHSATTQSVNRTLQVKSCEVNAFFSFLFRLPCQVARASLQRNNDPLDAAIFYLALKKKAVVWGLYR